MTMQPQEPTAPRPEPSVLETLQEIIGVIDMSDPESTTFADSAADCLDELLRHEADIRGLLARLQPELPAGQ